VPTLLIWQAIEARRVLPAPAKETEPKGEPDPIAP